MLLQKKAAVLQGFARGIIVRRRLLLGLLPEPENIFPSPNDSMYGMPNTQTTGAEVYNPNARCVCHASESGLRCFALTTSRLFVQRVTRTSVPLCAHVCRTYVCLCVCVSVHLCVCASVCLCVCAYVSVCICVRLYVFMCVFAYLCMCLCMYLDVWMCVRMCVCVWRVARFLISQCWV